jgi:hypothetical protein
VNGWASRRTTSTGSPPPTPGRTATCWREKLEELAGHEGGGPFDVRDDLERGRSRMLRPRVGAAGSGLLVGAVVLGTALAWGGGGTARHGAPGPAATGPSAVATFHEPQVTVSTSPSPSSPTRTADPYERIRDILDTPDGPRSPFAPWRHRLFGTVQDVLDPAGAHLDYGSDGMVAATDDHGVSLGIKLGWTNPGASGQEMVQVEVDTLAGGDEALCAGVGLSCSQTVRFGGATMRVGDGERGSFVVVHRQPDGERVLVLVDLFAATTPACRWRTWP